MPRRRVRGQKTSSALATFNALTRVGTPHRLFSNGSRQVHLHPHASASSSSSSAHPAAASSPRLPACSKPSALGRATRCSLLSSLFPVLRRNPLDYIVQSPLGVAVCLLAAVDERANARGNRDPQYKLIARHSRRRLLRVRDHVVRVVQVAHHHARRRLVVTNLVHGKSSAASSSIASVVRAYTRGSLPSVTRSQRHMAARHAATSQTHLAYESSARCASSVCVVELCHRRRARRPKRQFFRPGSRKALFFSHSKNKDGGFRCYDGSLSIRMAKWRGGSKGGSPVALLARGLSPPPRTCEQNEQCDFPSPSTPCQKKQRNVLPRVGHHLPHSTSGFPAPLFSLL